ncbi:Zinc finger protein zop1 [Thalictrum thalictroides]|uniref:Zinc finger protein zop1 n=1 Tax=Thalictrum thalictroides TaxID=46969 RepID=A0A7J6X2B8_THATH|nr:Zinc finger protein zop1 [Thalictrum thalictroides]
MTEYWVSQGNKWCDFCKIYISNNPLSIGTHERGQRHKDSVTKRLASMRKENVAKEKEEKETARAIEQIEAKAKRSYQKDLAAIQQVRESSSDAVKTYQAKPFKASRDDWEFDSTSGYFFNQASSYYYDCNSGLYYSDALGKWAVQEEAFPASQGALVPQKGDSVSKKTLAASDSGTFAENTGATKYQKGTPPGLVVPGSVNPMRLIKGATSSVAVNKRKRQDGRPKVVSKEEEAALKAREAAKKRMEEREKPMLGLYNSY